MTEEKGEGGGLLDTADKVNTMSSKGWMSDLLGPMAKVFGKELGEWAQNIADKRKENTKSHIEEVTKRHPDLRLPETPKAAADFQYWVHGASEAEPGTPEAALWQSLLEDIMRNDGKNQSHLIDLAKQLAREDVHILLNINKASRSSIEGVSLDRLIELGLVKKSINMRRILFISFSLSLFYSTLFYLGFLPSLNIIYSIFFNNPYTPFFLPTFIIIMSVFFALEANTRHFSFRFIEVNYSNIGRELEIKIYSYLPDDFFEQEVNDLPKEENVKCK